MNILIVKLSAIGDVIHTLPALNALRRRFPDAHITWVVEAAAASLIQGHQALDRVLVSRRKQWIKELAGPSRRMALGEIFRFIRQLRDKRYDLVLDFQALLKSGMLVALARGRRKVGFDKGMQHMEHSYIFLNKRIPPISMEIHALKRNLIMLEALGIHSRNIEYHVPVGDGDRDQVDQALEDQGMGDTRSLICINPVAKWDTKLWQNHRFSELADRLRQTCGAGIVFTGAPEDRDTIEAIISGMTERAANLAGHTTLKGLAALFERADLVISTDTGPMHLAAAMDTPVVALFGPTAPWRTGPFGSGHYVVRTGIACSPCFKRQCSHTSCMNAIDVDRVTAKVKQAMGNS